MHIARKFSVRACVSFSRSQVVTRPLHGSVEKLTEAGCIENSGLCSVPSGFCSIPSELVLWGLL